MYVYVYKMTCVVSSYYYTLYILIFDVYYTYICCICCTCIHLIYRCPEERLHPAAGPASGAGQGHVHALHQVQLPPVYHSGHTVLHA